MNATGKSGTTSLHVAARRQNTELTRLLLDRGADIEIINHGGSTAYDIARFWSHALHVECLDAYRAERSALLTSPDLVTTLWASLVPKPPTTAATTGLPRPPRPFQHCPWPTFVSRFLPPSVATVVLKRVTEARVDASAFLSFLCLSNDSLSGEGMQWLRDELKVFLVYPESVLRVMREIQPLLHTE